ncbi:pulmonary surfactant-associated protein A2-like [Ranitomeya imitator]|uniref:pulmonary surfactant-associated protein A2-like n=1 Tax=Ranitomeya imitator TaxID=111125 RepID=UPI0037E8391C
MDLIFSVFSSTGALTTSVRLCSAGFLQLPKMFYYGSLLLTVVVSMVACLPDPLNLAKVPEIPSITKPISPPKVDANIPKPTGGTLKKIGLKGVPVIGNKPAQWQDLQRRVSRLEAVSFSNVLEVFPFVTSYRNYILKLEGRIQVVGDKMIATSGKEVDFATSNLTCNLIGGRIVSPMNEAENSAALEIVKKYNRYAYVGVIGGPVPGAFNYLNGAPVVFTRWRKGEPSGKGTEGCTEMYTDGQWNDKACNYKRLTVCEL